MSDFIAYLKEEAGHTKIGMVRLMKMGVSCAASDKEHLEYVSLGLLRRKREQPTKHWIRYGFTKEAKAIAYCLYL